MNPQDQNLNRINEVVTKGSSGVIVVPNNPSVDAIAAATCLYLGLTKMGKTITLASSSIVEDSMNLTASDKFQQTLSTNGNNLVISFPYTEGAIDKVDYNIQGDHFNLIVAPRQGFNKLNAQQVKYSYSGGLINFIITIDTPNLNNLGLIYTDNQNQFTGKDIINIDRHLTNAFFGTINFVNKASSSTCEIIYQILQKLGTEIDKDMATNLYAGLSAATNNFSSYSVNALTFELAANLLKSGAVKKRPALSQQLPQPVMGGFNIEKQPSKLGTVESEPQINEINKTPQDWLKPKIFKGGGLI